MAKRPTQSSGFTYSIVHAEEGDHQGEDGGEGHHCSDHASREELLLADQSLAETIHPLLKPIHPLLESVKTHVETVDAALSGDTLCSSRGS